MILELVVLEQLTQIQMIKLGAVQHSCQSEVLNIIGIVVLGVHSINSFYIIRVGDCLVCEVLVLIVLLGVCAGAFLVVVSIFLLIDAVYSHPGDG